MPNFIVNLIDPKDIEGFIDYKTTSFGAIEAFSSTRPACSYPFPGYGPLQMEVRKTTDPHKRPPLLFCRGGFPPDQAGRRQHRGHPIPPDKATY